MKATKCSKCGFVGFADQGLCKRCGNSVDLNDHAPVGYGSHVEKSRHGLWFKLKIVLGIAAIVVGAVVGYYKLTKYFDKTPLYLAAIRNFEKFKEPVSVRVNRKEITPPPTLSSYVRPEDKKAGSAVAAADVLEALGLIAFSVETSVRAVSGTFTPPGFKENFRDVKSKTLKIELTEKGRQEAANWKEADEPLSPFTSMDPLQGKQVLPWWIVPIGDREIVRIESVTPAPAESDLETVSINFRWRWRPNKLGESFDLSNGVYMTLPTKAQQAVTSLNMSSQSENFGIAKLHKKYGNWECVEISFSGDLLRKVIPG